MGDLSDRIILASWPIVMPIMERISKQPGNKIQINNRWRFNRRSKPAGNKQKPFLFTRAEGQAGFRPYCGPSAVGGRATMIKRKFFE